MFPRNNQTQWVGNVRPFVPRPKAVPVWSNKMIISEKGNGKFSTFSVKLLGPNTDFPTVSVNITLGSGTGVSFASLSPKEFGTFLETLSKWSSEFVGLIPQLEQQAVQLQGAKTAYDQQVARLRQAALQAGLMGMDEEQPPTMPGIPY